MMLNDELIGAYLDGELDQEKRALVEHWLASDNGAAARLERMRGADALIRSALPRFAPGADDAIAAMIMERPPARVVAFKQAMMRPWVRQAAAVAAACVLGILIGRGGAREVLAVSHGEAPFMAVNAELARILDRTPSGSAAPVIGGEVQMALTMQTAAGLICREFRATSGAKATDAVACRENGRWRMVVQAAAPQEDAGYRTAGAGASPLEAAVNALGGAAVLDEHEEAALLRSRWRIAD